MDSPGIKERSAVTASAVLPTVLIAFFLSGISGLVYQVVWVKLLGRVFGVSSFAASAVLGAYFGGLALGGYIGGKLADRHGGLRLYGALEVALGISVLAIGPLFDALTPIYRALYPALQDSLPLLTLCRFILSCLLLIVPTALLGAALPILTRTLASHSAELSLRLPRLYAWNTLGAVLGSIAAGYFLIGVLGLNASTRIAAGIDLLIGLSAIGLSRIVTAAHRDSPPPRPPASPATLSPASPLSRLALIVTFLSGFASLGYEVAWFRVLSLISDHSASTFSGIVAVVLVGIGLGSFAVAAFNKRFAAPAPALAAAQLGLGICAALWFPVVAAGASQLTLNGPGAQPIFSAALLILLAPCLFMGMSFPLAVQFYTQHSLHVGQSVGRMYSTNVIGAMLGSIVTGFVLIPALGAQRTLFALPILNFTAAGLLHARGLRPRIAWVSAGFVAITGMALILAPNTLYQHLFTRLYPELTVVRVHESLEGNVVLSRRGDILYIHTNGVHDADISPQGLAIHRLLGYMPSLLRPQSASALVIGLGGGATSDAIVQTVPGEVVIVELSEGMVAAAQAFAEYNHNILTHPRASLIVADGRNHLLLNDRQYSVMTADTIYPTLAYSSNLYSVDYYRLVAEHLTDDGVAVQWIDTGLQTHEQHILIRTFIRAFPYVSLWQQSGLTLVAGSSQPLAPNAVSAQEWFTPDVARDIAPLGIVTVQDVLEGFTLSDDALRTEIGPGLIISDDHPYNEYFRLLRIGGLWQLLPPNNQ